MQNAYNRPDAQMERLKEAGLNPNLIYGQGKATGNTGSAIAPYQATRVDTQKPMPFQSTMQAGSALGQYQDFRMKNAQIDLTGSQQQKVQQEADLALAVKEHIIKTKGSQAGSAYSKSIMDMLNMQGLSYQHGYDSRTSTFKGSAKDSLYGRKYQAELAKSQYDARLANYQQQIRSRDLEYYYLNMITRSLPSIGVGIGRFLKGKAKTLKVPKTKDWIRPKSYTKSPQWYRMK